MGNKMRAQGERAAHRLLAVDHGDGDGALVARGRADTCKHLGRHVFVTAVNDDRLKSPPGQLKDCRIRIAAKFNRNFQVTEDSPASALVILSSEHNTNTCRLIADESVKSLSRRLRLLPRGLPPR